MRNLPTLKSDGKVITFFNRITRKHLIIIGFIFLGLLSFILLIHLINQAHKHEQNDNTNTNNNEYCLSEGCLSAAAYQLNSMNITASSNLCTDFYTYACGGWEKTHPIQSFDVERTILGDIINQRNMEIERLLNAPISRINPKSWEYKLKTYYSECLDDYAREPNSGKYMIGLIQDPGTINGWFVFDNNAKNDSQEFLLKTQTIHTQMSVIHGTLGVLVVFGIRTRFDETNPTVKRLEFFPAGLSMEINDYLGDNIVSEERRAAYQIYITDVLDLLAQEAGITDENLSNRIITVANDVLTAERYLAEILQRYPSDTKPKTMTLKQMSEEFSFNFIELMKHELGNPNVVSNSTIIYLTNPMYFTDAFEFLAKNNDPIFARIIHNYFRWRLIRTYINDLSYNYIHIHRKFLEKYSNKNLHLTNEEYCTREIIRKFSIAIQRLYTMNSTRYSNTITTIQKIFNLLKNGFKEYINQHEIWMTDETTKNFVREKIDALTIAIGYANIASNDTLLDNYYEKVMVSEESHFQNAYLYHRFHQWSLSNSLTNPNLLDHWDLFETQTNQLFDYIPSFNRLFIIASGMQEPLVNSQWPWSMNMGSIGVLLAQKLFASIDNPEGRTHLPNGTRFDWWASPTVIGYSKSLNCITDYYINELKFITYNINNVQIQVPLSGEPFSPLTLRQIGALHFAYITLKTSNQRKSFKMPGTNLTNDQTFFLAYAQTQCYQRQELSQFIRTKLGIYDERTALNTALIHMPEFAQAFQCKSKTTQCLD